MWMPQLREPTAVLLPSTSPIQRASVLLRRAAAEQLQLCQHVNNTWHGAARPVARAAQLQQWQQQSGNGATSGSCCRTFAAAVQVQQADQQPRHVEHAQRVLVSSPSMLPADLLRGCSNNDMQQSQQHRTSRAIQGPKRKQPRLPANLNPLCTQVLANIKAHKLFMPGERVLVAVSGSHASMCLARILLDISAYGDWELVLAHITAPDVSSNCSSSSGFSSGEAATAAAGQNTDVPGSDIKEHHHQQQHLYHNQHQQRRDVVQSMALSWGLQYLEACLSGSSGTHSHGPAPGNTSHNWSSANASSCVSEALQQLADAAGCTVIATGKTASGRAATLLASLLTGQGAAPECLTPPSASADRTQMPLAANKTTTTTAKVAAAAAAAAATHASLPWTSSLTSLPGSWDVPHSHGLWEWQELDSAKYSTKHSTANTIQQCMAQPVSIRSNSSSSSSSRYSRAYNNGKKTHSSSSSSDCSTSSGEEVQATCARVVHPLLSISSVQAAEFCQAQGLVGRLHATSKAVGWEAISPERQEPGATAASAAAAPPPPSPPPLQASAKCANCGREEDSQAAWMHRDLLPYLRTHFNPKVDHVLARSAETLSADLGLLGQHYQLLGLQSHHHHHHHHHHQSASNHADQGELGQQRQQPEVQLQQPQNNRPRWLPKPQHTSDERVASPVLSVPTTSPSAHIPNPQNPVSEPQPPTPQPLLAFPLQPKRASTFPSQTDPFLSPSASVPISTPSSFLTHPPLPSSRLAPTPSPLPTTSAVPKLRTSRKAQRVAQREWLQRNQHSMAVQQQCQQQCQQQGTGFTHSLLDKLPVQQLDQQLSGHMHGQLDTAAERHHHQTQQQQQQQQQVLQHLQQESVCKEQPEALRVSAAIMERQLLRRGECILVAVSGGKDSLCLMHLLHQLAPVHNWRLIIGHCNHLWRPDAHANADHVRELASSLGLSYLQSTAPSPDLISTEASARHWRYNELARMASAAGCSAVVTGHTASDRAETLLLNLLRGAGMTGMQALGWTRPLATAEPIPPLASQTPLDMHASKPERAPSGPTASSGSAFSAGSTTAAVHGQPITVASVGSAAGATGHSAASVPSGTKATGSVFSDRSTTAAVHGQPTTVASVGSAAGATGHSATPSRSSTAAAHGQLSWPTGRNPNAVGSSVSNQPSRSVLVFHQGKPAEALGLRVRVSVPTDEGDGGGGEGPGMGVGPASFGAGHRHDNLPVTHFHRRGSGQKGGQLGVEGERDAASARPRDPAVAAAKETTSAASAGSATSADGGSAAVARQARPRCPAVAEAKESISATSAGSATTADVGSAAVVQGPAPAAFAPGAAELRLVRPLLCMSCLETSSYCTQEGLRIWEDSTNADIHTARRNRVRIQLLPKLRAHFGPDVELTLSRKAEALAHDLAVLEQDAGQLLREATERASSLLEDARDGSFAQDSESDTKEGGHLLDLRNAASSSGSTSSTSSTHSTTTRSSSNNETLSQGSPRLAFSRSLLRSAPLALQRRAVKQWLEQQVPYMRGRVNFAKVEAILGLLNAPNHTMTMTLAHVPRQPGQQQQQQNLMGSQLVFQSPHWPVAPVFVRAGFHAETSALADSLTAVVASQSQGLAADKAGFARCKPELAGHLSEGGSQGAVGRRGLRRKAAKDKGVAVAAYVMGDCVHISDAV